ncbi:MAG TPA: OB-fold nucleic acid binding domain-containing protein [Candidatus Acidoferrum sp.]|nr:OB-fold nucleic acid binding domain-containing protein [Candidatus Acidoferrum sp.]
MKSPAVSDLRDGQAVEALFLVCEKEVRTAARGNTTWLQLDLGDRTGSISAKMWENFEPLLPTFEEGDVIRVRARVKLYNGRLELTVEQITPVAESAYEIADFLPHTKYDIETLYAGLLSAVASVKNQWLRQLLTSVVEDPMIAPRLKRAPAAMTMHHAFIGGLLEHIVSLIGLSTAISAHYPEIDSDLLLAGVVLHDIGKVDELRYAREIDYTTEGRLLGHIMLGVGMVRDKIKAIPGFPPALAVMIEHLILSHHGTHEFGSPSLPQTREAVALHYLDDLDSKMAAIRATLESPCAPDGWSQRNPSLRRALINAEKYIEGGSGASKSAQTATRGASSGGANAASAVNQGGNGSGSGKQLAMDSLAEK